MNTTDTNTPAKNMSPEEALGSLDIDQLIQSANEFRKNIESMEKDASNIRADGRSPDGLVRVVVNGLHEMLQVKVERKAVDAANLPQLEERIKVAVNQAIEKASQQARDRIQAMATKMGIDPNEFNKMGAPDAQALPQK